MPLTVDKAIHMMRVECDGKPTPLHCDVALCVERDDRDECNLALYSAGWRIRGDRTLCRACAARELKRMEAKRSA